MRIIKNLIKVVNEIIENGAKADYNKRYNH